MSLAQARPGGSMQKCAVTNHDKEGDIGGSQGLQGLRLVWGPPVVEYGACDVEASWRVNGELPVDVVFATLPSQRCQDRGGRVSRKAEHVPMSSVGHRLLIFWA